MKWAFRLDVGLRFCSLAHPACFKLVNAVYLFVDHAAKVSWSGKSQLNQYMVDKHKTLEDLPIGSRGVVFSVEGNDQLAKRLLEMGIMEGEEIEVIAKAPLGDPVEIRLTFFSVSLRLTEARRILVSQPGS